MRDPITTNVSREIPNFSNEAFSSLSLKIQISEVLASWFIFEDNINQTKSQWQLKRLRSEPTSRLSENLNKEKKLSIEVASSRTFSYNASLKQKI